MGQKDAGAAPVAGSLREMLPVWCGETMLKSSGPLGAASGMKGFGKGYRAESIVVRLKRLRSPSDRNELCDSLDAWIQKTEELLNGENESSTDTLINVVLSERLPLLIGILKRLADSPVQEEADYRNDTSTLVANWVANIYGNVSCARSGLDLEALSLSSSQGANIEEAEMTALIRLVREAISVSRLPLQKIVRKALVIYFAQGLALESYEPCDGLLELVAIGFQHEKDTLSPSVQDPEQEQGNKRSMQHFDSPRRLALAAVLLGFGHVLDKTIPATLSPIMFALLVDAITMIGAKRTRERLGLSELKQSDLVEEHQQLAELEALHAEIENQERMTEAAVALLAAKALG